MVSYRSYWGNWSMGKKWATCKCSKWNISLSISVSITKRVRYKNCENEGLKIRKKEVRI